MKKSVWLLPFSIQIATKERTAVISINDSIWVEHGDDSYNELLSELVSFLGEQIVKETIQHVRCLWLSWVYSACDNNSLLLSMIFQVLAQPVAKASKMWARSQEVVFIILEKAFDFFFKRCFK